MLGRISGQLLLGLGGDPILTHSTIRCKNDTKKVNNGVLMLNVMSHHTGCDDKGNCSHDGCRYGPMRGEIAM